MADDELVEKLEIQKKVFGRWINAHLLATSKRLVTDLFFDLRDGEILIDLVSGLFSQRKSIKKEQGTIRVQKLRNVDLALNALREDRVKVPSDVSSADIVDGHAKATLDLVWAIILHFQFLRVLKQSSTATLNSVEKPLLLWCQQASAKYDVEVKDFTRSLADGLALCCILHSHKSDLFDVDQAKVKSPRERLEFVFRLMEQHFGVAKILDPEDVHTLASDKKAVMTYVMSMFEVLPHDFLLENDEAIEETVNLGSPVKNPSSLKSGKLLDYDTFCRLHEDVHAWLLDAEDKLKFMQSVSNDLNVVKRQFDDNAEYMSELDTHQKAVGEVIRKGRHLLCSNLTSFQEKDVRVRKKVLIDSWEGLRKQALDRQNVLHEKLMTLQRSEMQKLRNWMTGTEDKISRMSVVGCTMEAIEAQEREHSQLEKSLEDQHDTVHSISNFIYVETENGSKTDSKAADEEIDEADLEGQLMALGERWTVLCTWVEERAEILRITRDELELVQREKDRLTKWLDHRESALREMDRNPSENHEELGRQGHLIAAIQREWSTEQRALLNINSVAEKLVSRCIATSPENGGHPESFKEDAASFAKTVEAIQDRWDILTEILEAQKQRVARQGIDIEKMSHLPHKIDLREEYSGACSSGGEENTPKKRRITGTKRIEFETAYAKASCWLQNVLEGLPEAKLEAVKRLEVEIKDWRGRINEAVSLGEDLMGDIQSEDDFPPDYLNNVSEKVKLIRDQMAQVESKVPDLMRDLSYESKKAQLYQNLEDLSQVLYNYEAWLKEPTSSESDLSKEIAAMKANLTSHKDKLSQLKGLANETLLHPGAAGDPANKIKADLYKFCEHWDGLESRLSEHHAKLLKSKSHELDVSVRLQELPMMEDKLRSLVAQQCDNRQIEELKQLIERLKAHQDAIEGITLWMEEVSAFLIADDAPFGDVVNLECQMKDSDSLIGDIETLTSKLDSINQTGGYLMTKCDANGAMAKALESELVAVKDKWKEVASLAHAQNARVKKTYDRSKNVLESLNEIQSFMTQVSKDLPDDSPVKKPTELSQRTFKLLHFKDKIERKRGLFESLLSLRESPELMSSPSLVCTLTKVEESWKRICDPIIDSYRAMKLASTEYGEFKTLVAQESDWLERLEKKLRKSANSAADAEEISEELNEIENFLDNHPEDRLERISYLAESLTEKNILISTWQSDAQKLHSRWEDLSQRARNRTALLETSIAEAQEWEYKLIAVQDWLTDRDIVLSSHLEHELTVDDLPDESQKEAMLREFEDQENLLAEMDEQVDAYRAVGKLEAALRLEDQLHLIHERFQELTMKFELFQQQPTVEYEPRLARVARQLRDIKEKLYLTELASAEKEGIEGQLHHARCIQNALSDIKAEVGNLMKIGRKILDNETFERKMELKEKIDALEKEYHEAGCEVIQASRKLNEALALSEKHQTLTLVLEEWLSSKSAELADCASPESEEIVPFVKESVQDMLKHRDAYEEIRSINARFFEHCNPALLTTLKENMVALDAKWTLVHDALVEKVTSLRKLCPNDEELVSIADDLDELIISESRKLSSLSQDETPLFEEFRSAFQEISTWIHRAEQKLNTNRESQERAIGREIDEWEPKIGNLRKMAEKLVQLFVSQKADVEPEMDSINAKWMHIVREVEKRLEANQSFKMVEVEEIKTTISHLSIPLTEPVVTITQPSPVIDPDEEIETLIEEDFKPPLPRTEPPQPKIRFSVNTRPLTPKDYSSSSESLGSSVEAPKSKSPKTPPQPLPKPRWYLEQRAKGVVLPVSPEKVKVTENTLPSPQRLIGTVEKTESCERHMPEKAVLVSASTTPSSTVESPMSNFNFATPEEDDVTLAKDSAAIDHLLAETEFQLEEVARHVKDLGVVKDKELLDFEADVKAVLLKIDKACSKLDNLDSEHDLKLRKDLIDMEVKVLEAQVPALISRGDTLILMAHRKDPNCSEAMRDLVSDLRRNWLDLKARSELKKSSIVEIEAKLVQFKKEMDQLKRWLSSAKVRLVRASHNSQVAKQFIIDVKKRHAELDHFNHLVSQLQQANAIEGQEMAVNIINADWSDVLNGAKPLMAKEATSNGDSTIAKPSATPGSPLLRSAPAEVATRMAKMLDALAAIDRQLETQILSTDRPCENLHAQSEALGTVKNALDRLRPSLRQTDLDLDKLSGSLSMEYFEKLSNSNSQLHNQWDKVRHKYAQRQEIWNSSKKLESDVESRINELHVWLKNVGENAQASVGNEDVASKGKIVAELTSDCKELMSKTSAHEAMILQGQVDGILRRWKSVLGALTQDRQAASNLCEKVDSMSLLLSRSVNTSDLEAMRGTIQKLTDTQNSIADLRSELCRRLSMDQNKDASFLKARTTVERLAVTIPRRIEVLKEKEKRLESLMSNCASVSDSIASLQASLKKAQSEHDPVKQQGAFKSLHLSVANIQYDVNRVLNEYGGLEREVSNNQFDVDPQTSAKLTHLKTEWIRLSGEVRHLAAGESAISHAVAKEPLHTSSSQPNSASVTSPHSPCSVTSESCVSPTTCSQSSFLSDEGHVDDVDELAARVERELQQMLEESTQLSLPVHDPATIRCTVDHQQQVMRRLEAKREYLDNLVSPGKGGRSASNIAVVPPLLLSRVGVLRDQLDITKHRVLSRKSECTAMASDSEQFARKLNEIDSWLARLDGILQSTYPLGQTLDVLEHQHQCTMDALKELSKYDHHIKLFMQVCERMNHVYARDDTEHIKMARTRVEEKHKSLIGEFTKRRNEVQAVQNSFASYDRSVERFFDWLFDIESAVEQLEEEIDSSPNLALTQKFEDIKLEIHDKDRVFTALSATGNALLGKMANEEKTMLGQKLTEMSSRWKDLQNKMLDINMNLRPRPATRNGGDSVAHISIVHANLRDHMDWVLRKKRELASLSLDGDVKGLRRQFEEHVGFRHQLSERGQLIQASIASGKSYCDKKEAKPDFRDCLKSLEFEWRQLMDRSDEWYDDVNRMMESVKLLEDKAKELNKLLLQIESELSHVGLEDAAITIDNDFAKAESLHQDLLNRANSILQLSQSNRRELEELSRRLRIAHSLRPMENSPKKSSSRPVSTLDPANDQDFLSTCLPSGWERSVEEGIPYYINHQEQRTQWDHPEFTDLMASLLEMNTVKYSVYRMALKLRKVQQKLCLDLLDIKSALFGFEEHGLTADRHDSFIKVPQMVVVLTSIYEAVHEEEPEEVDVPMCVELCLNWLLNVYDPARSGGQIRVLSFKIGILLLCRGPLTEKYIQLYNFVSSGDKLTPRQLALLLFDAIQIPKFHAEVAAFGGSDIEPSVRSCFSSFATNKVPTVDSLDCKQFLKWLQREPQTVVWLPVLHRLSAAETATHNTKCKVCKIFPIVGFRYNCLKCFNFDLCHNCFFLGLTAKGHKADHPMREFCTSTGRSANMKIIGQAIRNSFRTKKYFKKKQEKLGYLPVASLTDGNEFSPTISPNMSLNSRASEVSSQNNTLEVNNANLNNGSQVEKVDEHNLIAEYCQMLHQRTGQENDDEHPMDIEASIKDLESERRALMAEYRDLTKHVTSTNPEITIESPPEDDIEEQTKQLRQQTSRMETRMKILMDHNGQLELQLQRLRQLVRHDDIHEGSGGQFGTLQSKSIVAQDLNVQSPTRNDDSQMKQPTRLPPPLSSSRDLLSGPTDDEDDGEDEARVGSQSSLDLSAHETQAPEDSE